MWCCEVLQKFEGGGGRVLRTSQKAVYLHSHIRENLRPQLHNVSLGRHFFFTRASQELQVTTEWHQSYPDCTFLMQCTKPYVKQQSSTNIHTAFSSNVALRFLAAYLRSYLLNKIELQIPNSLIYSECIGQSRLPLRFKATRQAVYI